MNHSIMFLDQSIRTNLASASFSYFLELLRMKNVNLKSVIVKGFITYELQIVSYDLRVAILRKLIY